MYDKLIEGLGDCFSKGMQLLLHRGIEPCSLLLSSLYSFTHKSDLLFFLTDFQNKDFVRQWCEQNEKETCLNIKRFRDLAEELDEFPTVHPTKSVGEKYDDLISNLSIAVPILDKMISDIKG